MPFKELFKGYPFSGALAKFTLPPGPDDWQPKAWGTTGRTEVIPNKLHDDNAHFITDGVQVGDVFYITSADPPFTVKAYVTAAAWENVVNVDQELPNWQTDIVYKIGEKAPHTLQTLGKIIAARGLNSYTLHWNTLWTQAPFIDFDHTQLGDVYVCHD